MMGALLPGNRQSGRTAVNGKLHSHGDRNTPARAARVASKLTDSMLRPTTASPNAHFLVGELPAGGEIRSRWLSGTAFSIAVHVLGVGALLYTATQAAHVAKIVDAAADRVLIFLPQKGPEGGGGGRNGPQEPPRPAEIVATKPMDTITPIPKPADVPTPDIIVAMQAPLASQTLPGTLSPLDVPGTAATGGGTGSGIDGGRGSGVGPGDRGNHGGGSHQIGNG